MLSHDVKYSLDKEIRNEIVKVKDICMSILNDAEIMLFGSIAKGKYKSNSDIDLLILINEDKELKELRLLRHRLEDVIDEIKLSRSVDIKLYSKNRYIELCSNVSFENSIMNDLIDIRGWNNG